MASGPKDAIMLLLLSYAKATAKFPEENQDLFNNLSKVGDYCKYSSHR